MLQMFGAGAFLLPFFVWLLGWKWICSSPFSGPKVKLFGAIALWLSVSSACGLMPFWHPLRGGLAASGVAGMLIADYLISLANPIGAAIVTAAWAVIALYLMTTFEVALLRRWFGGPIERAKAAMARWHAKREASREQAIARARQKAAERAARRTRTERHVRGFRAALPPES